MSSDRVEMEHLISEEIPQQSRGWAAKAGALLGIAGLAGVAAAAVYHGGATTRQSLAFGQKDERLAITPSFPSCSGPKDNCFETGCCQTSGHQCWVKDAHEGRCNLTCTPGNGMQCGLPLNGQPSVPVQSNLPATLYCFAVYTENTGSSEESTELDLLKLQKQHGVSLYGCDAWDVYADVAVPIDEGYTTIMVQDVYNEFHQIKRKETKTWVNWALFYQVWVQVREVGRWEKMGWTVKVDADAVFIPQRMRDWLAPKGESPHGVYFENCPNVQYGFFGNLEVMSNTATKVLTKYLEDCHAVYAPCANDGCDWKWGSWGEDVFVQRCMDRHYVDKIEAFDITTDGACESDRPEGEKKNKKWHLEDCTGVTTAAVHPFKKSKDYFRCMGQIMGTSYAV